ncbi:MAG TPA: M56 family metallopeptidase [Thermoanaerobaculia bacterium]
MIGDPLLEDGVLPGTLAGATWLWRVALHSFVAGTALYAWSRRLELPPGRTRRLLLAAVLVVPLLTAAAGAALPGDAADAAWFDSRRVLALPLAFGLQVADLAVAAGVVTAAVALVQEVLPALLERPRRSGAPIPLWLGREARSLPGWERCTVQLVAGRPLLVATGGLPGGRPHLHLSPDVLERLSRDELAAVLRHENAHHTPRRWWALHLLFAARLLQLANPVALWVFRGYTLELELACDRDAVARPGSSPAGDRDPTPDPARALARALLTVYEGTDRRDVAGREALRRRVDALLGRARFEDRSLPPESLAAAVVVLLLTLPWIV